MDINFQGNYVLYNDFQNFKVQRVLEHTNDEINS